MKKSNFGAKQFAITLCCVAGLIGVVAVAVLLRSENYNIEKKAFSNLSSFNKLDTYSTDSNSISDDALGSIVPVEAYVNAVVYSGKKYKVYAYIFEDDFDAFLYYKQATGYESADKMKCFYYQNSSFGGTDYVVYYDRYAYRINGGKLSDFSSFVNWLVSDFPVDIGDEYYNEYGFKLP